MSDTLPPEPVGGGANAADAKVLASFLNRGIFDHTAFKRIVSHFDTQPEDHRHDVLEYEDGDVADMANLGRPAVSWNSRYLRIDRELGLCAVRVRDGGIEKFSNVVALIFWLEAFGLNVRIANDNRDHILAALLAPLIRFAEALPVE